MKKFFLSIFSFAHDSDGFSLKDVTTLCVLTVWVTTVLLGLFNDYTNDKLEQFEMVFESVTELTMVVVLSTLGLVAAQSFTSVLSKRFDSNQNNQSLVDEDKSGELKQSYKSKEILEAPKAKEQSDDII